MYNILHGVYWRWLLSRLRGVPRKLRRAVGTPSSEVFVGAMMAGSGFCGGIIGAFLGRHYACVFGLAGILGFLLYTHGIYRDQLEE